jgi:peptidoglycan/LPS O-acetylase OafA/YrhL
MAGRQGAGNRPWAGGGASIDQAGEQRSTRIESLRAMAALGVVVSHIYGAAFAFGPTVYRSFWHRVLLGGGFGVWLFFVLSGYLLFWPFAKRLYGDGGPIDLRSYALNRALRILPLYYVAVVVFMLAYQHGGTAGQWWRFLLLAENFSTSTLQKVDGVMWSLTIELQFYVLLPPVAWLLARAAARSARRAALLLGLAGLASLALRIHFVPAIGEPHPLWKFSLPTTFFFFVAGMLLALGRVGWERRAPRWSQGALGRADVWLLASVPLWTICFWRYSLHPLAALAAALMVAACVLPLRQGRLVRALEWRPLAAIGVASYSLYLWHFPIVAHLSKSGPLFGSLALSYLALVPLCVAVAFVSYAAIEAPFLRLRKRWAASAPAQEYAAVLDGPAVEAPSGEAPEALHLARERVSNP